MARNTYYRTDHWRSLKRATHERDRWRCVIPGCSEPKGRGLVCDHIETRPNVDYPTAADTIANTRTLCAFHDRQIKEQANGKRRNDGKASVRGCDVNGWPLDPSRAWGVE